MDFKLKSLFTASVKAIPLLAVIVSATATAGYITEPTAALNAIYGQASFGESKITIDWL